MRLLSIACGLFGAATALMPMNTGTSVDSTSQSFHTHEQNRPSPVTSMTYHPKPTGNVVVIPLTAIPRLQNPSGKCVRQVFAGGKFDFSPTCYRFAAWVTETVYIPCGGCELRTMNMGHGPAKRCTTYVNLPATTKTVTACQRGG